MIFNLITKAKDLFFNNTGTGLNATNTQDAITEVNTKISNKQDKLTDPLVKASVVNNLTTNVGNLPLSASMGKALKDYSDQINSSLLTVSGETVPAYNFGDFGAIDENTFITYLRAWISGNITSGRTGIINGWWAGKIYCGFATKVTDDVYFAYVNVRGGSVYAVDDYSWGKL